MNPIPSVTPEPEPGKDIVACIHATIEETKSALPTGMGGKSMSEKASEEFYKVWKTVQKLWMLPSCTTQRFRPLCGLVPDYFDGWVTSPGVSLIYIYTNIL